MINGCVAGGQMGEKRRSFYGWGFEGDAVSAEELGRFERTWSELFQVDGFDPAPMPREPDITLRAPRLALPAVLHL
jgi:alkyldihydroxyacetonephosphate synthase